MNDKKMQKIVYLCIMKNPKLSIIVPVYRVPATLDVCVESIVAQTWEDWELILVDDGSDDECAAICDQWCKLDRRISAIHQVNQGLSVARNTGIAKAVGTYITFVDSDDWLDADTLGPIIHYMERNRDCDLAEYEISIHEGGPQPHLLQLQQHRYYIWTQYWLEQQAYQHTYAHNKVYRRTLFDEVRFPVGRVFEDAYIMSQLLRKCKCIATLHHGCYHYMWNEEGITVNASTKDMQGLVEAYMLAMEWINANEKGFIAFVIHVVNVQLSVYEAGGKICCEHYFKSARRFLRVPNQLAKCKRLHMGLTGKDILKVILFKLIGIKWLCKIFKMFSKISRMTNR